MNGRGDFPGTPPADAARYRRDGYWRGERLGDLLRTADDRQAGKIAVVAGRRRWSYAELDHWADRIAWGLLERGFQPGDRVVVQLPNIVEFVVVCVALFRVGVIPVLALPAHRQTEITQLCLHTDAAGYVVADRYRGMDYRALARDVVAAAPTVRRVIVVGEPDEFVALTDLESTSARALPAPDPSSVALLLLSGGTTGTAKLIPRTHDDYAFQLRATAEQMGFDAAGVYLAVVPVAHNAGLGCPGVLGALRAGATAVLAATPSPDEAFPLIAAEHPTLTTLMPSFVTLWLDLATEFDADLSGLVLEVGGARLPEQIARRVEPELGCTLTQWFGMGEGPLVFTRPGDDPERRYTTQGRPLSEADEWRIVDDADREVRPETVGHLLFRGPTTIRGYYRAEAANASAFTADGFLRTGDLARRTADGCLVVEGRVKDIVNRGGEKVSAEEVEAHILAHPAVRRVSVVAVPDRLMGEKTCAVVVSGTALTLGELRDFLDGRGVAEYKWPDQLATVAELPLTHLGKVDKVALRRDLAGKADSRQASVIDSPRR